MVLSFSLTVVIHALYDYTFPVQTFTWVFGHATLLVHGRTKFLKDLSSYTLIDAAPRAAYFTYALLLVVPCGHTFPILFLLFSVEARAGHL
jgi:hypothetical protein